MKNITLIARVLISALFLLSAVAKLYPTPLYGITKVFEEGQLIPMGFSSDFAPFLSRLIIGFEFFIAIAILITSKGSLLYWSDRVGINNTIFKMPKFRSMIDNTPAVATHLLTDPESFLSPIGGFIRRTSLDELPQFINVLFGEMSVIGPRPHAIKLNNEYNSLIQNFNKRHKFKPGITGLAQSKGFNGLIGSYIDMKNRVKLDIFYFKNWSLLLDLKIVFMTIFILIKFPFKSFKN